MDLDLVGHAEEAGWLQLWVVGMRRPKSMMRCPRFRAGGSLEFGFLLAMSCGCQGISFKIGGIRFRESNEDEALESLDQNTVPTDLYQLLAAREMSADPDDFGSVLPLEEG